MGEASVLRFDELPLDDFLVSLMQHEKDVRVGYLPAQPNLKEVRFSAKMSAPPNGPGPINLFILQETDALSQATEEFVILSGLGGAARRLRDEAIALRDFLRNGGQPALFRIDPRYGLVCGSALEPVDPSVRWDRPGAYVALYLASSPDSPSLAVMEYIPHEQRRRFSELFLKYNQVPPTSGPSFLAGAWKKLRGGSPATPAGPPTHISYRMVKLVARFLRIRGLSPTFISLIYKGVQPEELPSLLLDSRFAVTASGHYDRFFASLSELA